MEPDPALTCACRPDEDGIYEDSRAVCDQHRMRMYGNEYNMRAAIDAEQDERFDVMFGKRNLARPTAPLANFEVKR